MQRELSSPEHEHSAAADQAAQYLAITPPNQGPAPLVPTECCEAMAESHASRGGTNAITS